MHTFAAHRAAFRRGSAHRARPGHWRHQSVEQNCGNHADGSRIRASAHTVGARDRGCWGSRKTPSPSGNWSTSAAPPPDARR